MGNWNNHVECVVDVQTANNNLAFTPDEKKQIGRRMRRWKDDNQLHVAETFLKI
jgi:hypothetical protein